MRKNSEKLEITKSKIRAAAVKLMSNCEEPWEVTSRAIVAEAGVQLAMINYCFGSREALLCEVFQELINETSKNNSKLAMIIHSDASPKEKLRQLHYHIVKQLLDHFTFTKAITKYVLLNRDLTKGTNSLPFVIAHYQGRKTEKECRLIAYELSSIVQLIVLRQEAMKEFAGLDLSDDSQLKAFIDMQIDLFLPD